MKLTRVRKIGRYTNPETGRKVNVHKGTKVGYGTDALFFIRSGKRVVINDSEFYREWKESKS